MIIIGFILIQLDANMFISREQTDKMISTYHSYFLNIWLLITVYNPPFMVTYNSYIV